MTDAERIDAAYVNGLRMRERVLGLMRRPDYYQNHLVQLEVSAIYQEVCGHEPAVRAPTGPGQGAPAPFARGG